MLDKTHFAAALLSVGFVVFSSSCATVILSLNLQGWEWDYKEMQGHFRKIQRRVDLLLKYGLYVVDHNLMFGQWPTANSNVSWSSSAWDCTEAWEVVSLFVIRISLWHNFSRSSKNYKKAPLSTWNYLQGNSSSSRTQSSGSSWRPAAIGTPRLAQRTMSTLRVAEVQNAFS